MDTNLKLSVRIIKRDSGKAVFYKHDGQRFEQTHTVKMNADKEYDIMFTLNPAMGIEKLLLNGEAHKIDRCHDNNDEYEDTRTYVTHYETVGVDVCRRGKRRELLFVLELENGVYMKLSVQCKVYKFGETTHCSWGQQLAGIELDCKIEKGQNYVNILHEKYF
ncbi:CB1 cannabinoid receptor-interacting protein 1-like [Ruditapes philippinarum]|uniref:CB1 cannabinoid receptor-interacting protein 1-like n=1 Tax=Ruditapes philippinarum TaxID=129788 RepID=UPI00295C029B|nr:CB1 cannabinoid receptor-interacting protein 1-like [Ruditapes philippinarum]